jgi:hypothetical protein
LIRSNFFRNLQAIEAIYASFSPDRVSKRQSINAIIHKLLSQYIKKDGLSDVITDMYEAVEALAKKVTGRDKDLSENRELFISKVKASDHYKVMLKDYIDYANDFRHAEREGKPKPQLSEREVESFVYLTGIFIRLAMPQIDN